MASSYIPAELRRQVIERAQGRCEYCQAWADHATEPFHVEHILPVSRGGITTLDNVAYACSGCNGHKYNKVTAADPFDGSEVPLHHPRQQRWQDHFRWNESYTQIIGLTPTGRATVDCLQMNRIGLVNLRRVLLLAGKQPPQMLESS